jgi:hypothetical protein
MEHGMKRLKDLLRQAEFQILLFLFGIFPFSWPILGVLENKHPLAVALYLFAGWAGFILLLFLVSRSTGENASEREEKEEESARC